MSFRSFIEKLDAEGGLARALQDRECGISYPNPTFSKTAVMSQLTGIDNGALLPPNFPAHRGEDALFGAMTGWIYPASAVLNHNWSVPHLPLDSRDARGARAPVAGRDWSGRLCPGVSGHCTGDQIR